MWKSMNPGDKVLEGDTIRYRSGSAPSLSSPDKIFDVVKTEQHYFEVVARPARQHDDDADRRIIKYMDVGYHLSLEIWSGIQPYLK
jgi:hypothetical protein